MLTKLVIFTLIGGNKFEFSIFFFHGATVQLRAQVSIIIFPPPRQPTHFCDITVGIPR